MGCNCGKTKAGSSPPPTGTNPPPDNSAAGSVTKGATESFTLQRLDGKVQTFGSRLEAQAARVRAGGGTVRRGS